MYDKFVYRGPTSNVCPRTTSQFGFTFAEPSPAILTTILRLRRSQNKSCFVADSSQTMSLLDGLLEFYMSVVARCFRPLFINFITIVPVNRKVL